MERLRVVVPPSSAGPLYCSSDAGRGPPLNTVGSALVVAAASPSGAACRPPDPLPDRTGTRAVRSLRDGAAGAVRERFGRPACGARG